MRGAGHYKNVKSLVLDWFTITTIVLGSSFLAAVLTNLVAWLIRRAELLRQANYLALNLAYSFEKYAYLCVSAVEDHDVAEDSYGNVGRPVTAIPEFPKLPDADYRVLYLKLLDRVFDFPQHVNFATESLSFAFHVLNGDEAVEEGYKHCLKLGRESLSIADSVRDRYGLPYRSLRFGEYSVRERIKEKCADKL